MVTAVSGFIEQVGSMIKRNSKTQLSSINKVVTLAVATIVSLSLLRYSLQFMERSNYWNAKV